MRVCYRRFLLGKGRYTDDIVLPGQTWAVFVRSPYAHAAIRSIDASAANATLGVLLKYQDDIEKMMSGRVREMLEAEE